MNYWYSLIALVVSVQPALARVQVAAPFTDHMVLQREMKVPVWGTATAGKTIHITFAGQTKQTTVNDAGQWKLFLDPLEASNSSRVMTIEGDEQLQLNDVLVGEVWVGSGQSNMQYSLSKTEDGKATLPAAKHPEIRIFQRPIGRRGRDEWMACTPQTAEGFSAVAYFFGKRLHEDLDVPVGLIVRAVGGTQIQRWVVPESIRDNALIQKHTVEAERRASEFPRYEEQKQKYDKRNKPTPEMQRFLTEMGQLAHYRGGGLGGLYARMIKPLQPFAIRGVIWYQGEFNNRSGQAYDYREWQACLVDGWRKSWGQGEFPFLFVQMQVLGNQTTALMRESQATTLARCPQTAMAVICDQSFGLHPAHKKIAGERLAKAAQSMVYQSGLPLMGPVLESHRQVDGKILLTFKHVGDGIRAKGGTLQGFWIAGSDKKFHVAQAAISSQNQIVVSCDQVPQPEAVRYAWMNDPREFMTLYNSDDLPASPFRTDQFVETGSLAAPAPKTRRRTPRRQSSHNSPP